MRSSLILVALLCVGCGSTSPTAPSTPPVVVVVPPSPAVITLSGTLTATNGGQALAGVDVAIFGAPAMVTTAGGAFTTALPVSGIYGLTLSSAAIVPRTVNALVNGSRAIQIGAISLGGGFDLPFYRELVRNTLDKPAGLEPLRRWTVNPSFYMKVTDEAGALIDAQTLDSAEQVIRATLPQWTDGTLAVATFERGTSTRGAAAGWINVNWSNAVLPIGDTNFTCGDAVIGGNPGTINLYYRAGRANSQATCRCAGGGAMGPRVVSHELGHAMGFYHAGAVNDVMFPGTGDYCDATPTTRERYHAAIAYARPVGNVDPDRDPVGAVNLAPMTVR